ncbi:BAG family molecular chaperone regulator 3-like isoform X1 [Dermacentor albipictus]|uniref:BAG family molecular chaperone regulator 3-like isoform X1 n=1 Tax=Dermacentor albipictus TaxID=60249 RepID=UPI0031FD9130
MSYRRVPFQFNPDRSSDERRSEILRRFGFQPEEDNMFYETNSPSWSTDWAGRFHRPAFYDDPEWRNTSSVFGNSGSMPGSPQSSRVRRGWTTEFDEGGVPIKVVHETTSGGGGGGGSHDEANDAASETSSQGSRSSCSSSRSGGANGASCSKSRHEPRVHHIPIMVEPRTGASSSAGYASDGELKPQSQARRTFAAAPSPKESQQQQPASGEPRNVHTIPVEVDGYPMQGQARSPSSHNHHHHHNEEMAGESQNVRTVPIEMDCGDEAMARCRVDDPMDEQEAGGKSWPHTFPRQKCQQSSRRTPSTAKSSSGGRLGPQASPPKQGSEPPPPQQQETKTQSTAEEQIRRISLELADLRQQVLNFSGRPGDKQYKFLDEMLTRLMIKLDAVDPAGRDDVRQLRKSMIREVQSVINLLEGRPPASALVEVVTQEVKDLAGEASPPNEEEGSESPSEATGAAAAAASAAPEVSPEVPPPPAVERVGGKDEKGDTPMEVEAPATAEAQPPPSVEMVPATSGGGASGEELPPAPELPTIPMPVDIDPCAASSSGNLAGGPHAGSASPFNEQNLFSLNHSEDESTHIEGSIPTEHSGSTEL